MDRDQDEAGSPSDAVDVPLSGREAPGQNSDARSPSTDGLDDFGHELNRLANFGLTAAGISAHRAELRILLQLVGGDDEDTRAGKLIDLVIDGCHRLHAANERYGASAIELFGTRKGGQGRPYSLRLQAAADAWEIGMEPATFNRRHRRKVIKDLEVAVLELQRDAIRASFRRWLDRDAAFQPLPSSANQPNLAFKRRHFRAVSHIVGSDRRPAYTDWTYDDVATQGGEPFFRIYTKEDDARVEILAASDNVEVERPLGVDPWGSQVWLVRFNEVPQRGQEVEWSVRKVFHRWDDEIPPLGHLSLAVSQPRPIESGTIEVNFEHAAEHPERFVRFITPKQTLPNLRGEEWPVIPVRGSATAPFEALVPAHSHGLMWFWRT